VDENTAAGGGEIGRVRRRGVALSTWQDTYRPALIPFMAWCDANDHVYAPTTQQIMLDYLDLLATRDPRPAPPTVWVWYSAVKFVHSLGDPPVPWECGRRLYEALDEYERQCRAAGWRPRRAPRADPIHIVRMLDVCDRDTIAGTRSAALILTSWWSAALAGQLAAMNRSDITITDAGVDVSIDGRVLHMPRNDTEPSYCPRRAIRAWTAVLQDHVPPGGVLWRPMDRWGGLAPAGNALGYTMAPHRVGDIIAEHARLAGLDAQLTCRSLRRGLMTWLRSLRRDPIEIARTYGYAPGGAITEYFDEADIGNPGPGTDLLLATEAHHR
jgi:hypothetical protein